MARVIDLGEGREIRVLEGDSYVDPSNGQSLTGAWVWDASIVLSMWFTTKAWPEGSFLGKRAVELGAGTALPGMTLAKLGAHVVLTDRKPLLAGLNANIRENELEAKCRACELQWGDDPAQLQGIQRAFKSMEEEKEEAERKQRRDSHREGGCEPSGEGKSSSELGEAGGARNGASGIAPAGPSEGSLTGGVRGVEEGTAPGPSSSSEAEGGASSSGPEEDLKAGDRAGRVDFVVGSDIMFDPESETMGSLSLAIKSLAGPGTRIFMCCELRPPLPECFRHMHDNGLRWKAVPQEELHPEWNSEDIKIFEFFVSTDEQL